MTLYDFLRPHSHDTGKAVAIGLVSGAAAAGITYFLFGTDKGARKRAMMMRWSREMRDEMVGEGSELTEVSREIYNDMKTMLRDKSVILKNVEKEEISALADRIRNHWEEVREDIEDTVDKVAKESKETLEK